MKLQNTKELDLVQTMICVEEDSLYVGEMFERAQSEAWLNSFMCFIEMQ